MKRLIFLTVLCLPLFFSSCETKQGQENPEYGVIFGSVVDAETSNPIAGVLITIMPDPINCYTGSDGTYQFENLVTPEKYDLTAQANGYRVERKFVILKSGIKQHVNFTLQKENK